MKVISLLLVFAVMAIVMAIFAPRVRDMGAQYLQGLGEILHRAASGYMARTGLMLYVNLQTPNAKGIVPAAVPMGQEVVQMRVEFAMAANPSVNDVLEMLIVPPGMKVIDWTIDSDDMDTNGSPTIAFKAGFLNAGKTDLGTGNNIFKTGITIAQTGTVQRMDTVTALRAGGATANRVFGLVWTAVAATFAAGTVGATLYLAAT